MVAHARRRRAARCDGQQPFATDPRPSAAARATTDQRSVSPADATAALSVRGLSVSFSGLEVVKNVSFDVRDGQTIGFVGESGCGKTVTASAVLGQLAPYRGSAAR